MGVQFSLSSLLQEAPSVGSFLSFFSRTQMNFIEKHQKYTFSAISHVPNLLGEIFFGEFFAGRFVFINKIFLKDGIHSFNSANYSFISTGLLNRTDSDSCRYQSSSETPDCHSSNNGTNQFPNSRTCFSSDAPSCFSCLLCQIFNLFLVCCSVIKSPILALS